MKTLNEIKAELEKKPFAKSLQGKDDILKLINEWKQELENKINCYDRKISQKQFVKESLRLGKIYDYIINSEQKAKLEENIKFKKEIENRIKKLQKFLKEHLGIDDLPQNARKQIYARIGELKSLLGDEK